MEQLLKGKYGGTLIYSAEDHNFVSKYKWQVSKKGYVFAVIDGKMQRIHRVLLRAAKGTIVDHINHNPRDNRRENLRFVTPTQSAQNTGKQKNTTSIYKGVYFAKHTGKWNARITNSKNLVNLGSFDTEKEAAEAYDIYVLKQKTFHQLNFPERTEELQQRANIRRQYASAYRGVKRNYNKFVACLTVNKKHMYLLFSKDEIECAKAYDAAVVKNNLSRKKLNFPNDYPNYVRQKAIPATHHLSGTTTLLGKVLIDTEDYDKIKNEGCYVSSSGYVFLSKSALSRFLMGVSDPAIYIDHINGNPLDNRKENLRLSNAQLNPRNCLKRADVSSQYIGVSKYRDWRAYVGFEGKREDVYAFFKFEEDAARARDLYILLKYPNHHFKLNFTWTGEDKNFLSKKLIFAHKLRDLIESQTKD